MKKRWKWKLIAFFAVLASVLLLGGCKFQYTLEEKRAETGMNARVTYYTNGNGAYFGTDVTMKKLYFSAGSVAINIGEDRVTNGTVPTPTRNNYTLLGWYEAEVDNEGNALLDENGEVVLKKKAFDFKQELKEGDDIVLYAKWQKNEAVNVYLVCDQLDTPFVVSDKTLSNKDFLRVYEYQSDNQRPMPNTDTLPKAAGYTAVGFYADEACTQEVAWPLTRENNGDCKIYAKYIKGNWIILNDANSVASMFEATTVKNYYLVKDIDCKGAIVKSRNSFYGKLQGNGFTIENFVVAPDTIKNIEVSMFGTLGPNARIENVTFKDVKFTCSLQENETGSAFLFFSSLTEGATIANVILKGNLTIDIKCEDSSIVGNMVKFDEWVYNNILFGGFETDEQAIDSGLGITIDVEAKLSVIKNDSVVLS